MAKTLKIVIIGSGSAAFSCAIKAAEGGAHVTIIESSDVIGGCCVNEGCIPSKILLHAAQLAEQQRHTPFRGLKNQIPDVDRRLLLEQQKATVDYLRHGKYQHILDSNPHMELCKGRAFFDSADSLIMENRQGDKVRLDFDRLLIATGSIPVIPDIDGLAESPYWTSREALFAEELPAHLMIAGSSFVALELAQAYRRLGSEVTLIARHELLHKEEPLLGKTLQKVFEEEGIRVLNNTRITRVDYDHDVFSLKTSRGNIQGDRLLICTGRKANTENLRLERAGIRLNKNGSIPVNDKMQSCVENIYAAGDCTQLPQFVYIAAASGSRAAINMLGGSATLDLSVIPAVMFTEPQMARVGLTESDAMDAGINTESRVLNLDNIPRAIVNYSLNGFIKMIMDKDSGRLIGVQILAQNAGEIIQTAALAIHNRMTVEEMAGQIFPYLTMGEGLKLCAQSFSKNVDQLSCCAG